MDTFLLPFRGLGVVSCFECISLFFLFFEGGRGYCCCSCLVFIHIYTFFFFLSSFVMGQIALYNKLF